MPQGGELGKGGQKLSGALFALPLSDDGYLVAAGGEPDPERLFDGPQVLIRDAEKGGESGIRERDGLVRVGNLACSSASQVKLPRRKAAKGGPPAHRRVRRRRKPKCDRGLAWSAPPPRPSPGGRGGRA